jgi:hypothetical protein
MWVVFLLLVLLLPLPLSVHAEDLARIIHEDFYCNRSCSGKWHESRGKTFLPVAPSFWTRASRLASMWFRHELS